MKQVNFKKELDENNRESVTISDGGKIRLDLVPRLLCLLFAVIIWIYCVNITEDDVVATYTVKLDIVGEMQNGLEMYSSSNVTEVTFTVRGTNRDINKYSASDYSATIDVSNINSVGWSTLKIITEKPKGSENSKLTILNTNIDSVSVYADYSGEVLVPLTIREGSINKPENYNFSYMLDNGVNSIRITGPKTIIEQVSKAEYLLEGEAGQPLKLEQSMEISGFPLSFYNDNGEIISAGKAGEVSSSFIKYDTSNMKVNVSVTTESPLKVIPTNGSEECIYDVMISSERATIIGDPVVLKTLPALSVDVNQYTDKGNYTKVLSANEVVEIYANLGYKIQLKEENVTLTIKVDKPVVETQPQV